MCFLRHPFLSYNHILQLHHTTYLFWSIFQSRYLNFCRRHSTSSRWLERLFFVVCSTLITISISFSVIVLTIDTFESLVLNKPITDVWLVDFYASWCGPCIQLAPQWRSLARMLSPLTNIHVGSVDCVTQELLCTQHGIRSYPTIRLYPMGRAGDIM